VADVVGDVVADFLQLLDAAGLLPDFRPQAFGLGLGIFAADEGFGRIGEGFGKVIADQCLGLVHDILRPG